ncbi:MAG: response regulator transcription factor [Kofleriaceae bacterium]|nr:response regulator transcription factor [Myxococcales bacterium]MCB9564868.1 response regulator transcription factor [Kofleriaceae bacterium]
MKKILVVEDDPVNLQILSDFLSAHGYQTTAAVTGPDGVDSFRRERPDLLLVDVQLPRKNGFEVCSEVRATPEGAHTPVLLMSAVYTDREHSERNAGPGKADGYLLKPFDLAELLLRVRGLIGDGARN